MKVFTASQIREWDVYTISNEPVTSIDLMERAAFQCSDWIRQNALPEGICRVFCGKGNNGGDGLAIARQLLFHGVDVSVYILEFGAPGTPDFQLNLQRLHGVTKDIQYLQDETAMPAIENSDLVIDCLYGAGLNRPLSGLSENVVHHINSAKVKTVAIDLPSGLLCDASSKGNTVVEADITLTFQLPKLAFLMPENEQFVGELLIFNIGLHPEFYQRNNASYEYVDATVANHLYRPRNRFSHKGTFGHSLLVAGSKGKMGAAMLASRACLRTGAGLVTTAVPEEEMPVMQIGFPEGMAVAAATLSAQDFSIYSAIAIGPGLSTKDDGLNALRITLSAQRPTVIDADGLNLLAQHKELMDNLPAQTILTPHPKEFERLFGGTQNQFERMELALSKAKQLNAFILVKGHYSLIACPDGKAYFNGTGNPGMATAGTGDVLTGMITGLLSQGYPAKDAIIFGVYLHGLAGDIAAEKLTQEAMIAGDIIKALPQAFKKVKSQN